MNDKTTDAGEHSRLLRIWFALTPQERLFIGGILAIALVGLTARYLHLRNEQPEPYEPKPVEQADQGGRS